MKVGSLASRYIAVSSRLRVAVIVRDCGSYAKVSYKGRGVREAAGEGTGDVPSSDAPAPPDPADVPLDRFFIRF